MVIECELYLGDWFCIAIGDWKTRCRWAHKRVTRADRTTVYKRKEKEIPNFFCDTIGRHVQEKIGEFTAAIS